MRHENILDLKNVVYDDSNPEYKEKVIKRNVLGMSSGIFIS